jgi:hypothetical protein
VNGRGGAVQGVPAYGHRGVPAQAIGGQIQISAVFGDDHYILRGTVTEAA